MKTDVGTTHERELLSACKSGDEHAFRRLFYEFHEQVLHLAIRLCGDIREAEDITQEVFLRVHLQLDDFKMQSEFSTWLYRITVNVCVDRNRKIKRRAKYTVSETSKPMGGSDRPTNSKTLDSEVWRKEVHEILQTALMRIKPKWRTVLVLKDLEGLPYNEIAQIAGCSEGTVSSRLNRGRSALRTILAELGIDKNYFRD
jgi:RNA polymerase sigma-70 factor (ECF subfamily)